MIFARRSFWRMLVMTRQRAFASGISVISQNSSVWPFAGNTEAGASHARWLRRP